MSLTPATPVVPTTPPSDADSTTPKGAANELAPGELAPGDQRSLPEVDDPTAGETSPPDITPADDPSVVAPSVEPMRPDKGAPETDFEAPSEPAVATSPNRAFERGTEQTAEQPPATRDGESPVGPEANAGTARDLRTWNDRPGRTIRARLIRVSEGRVTLERNDDKTEEVDLDLLSEADQDYVSTQTVSSILRPMTLTFTMTFTMTPTMSMMLKPTETTSAHDTADVTPAPDR